MDPEPITTPPPPSLNDSGTCMPQYGNKTILVYEGYGGVPETLIINAVAWVVLLFLFAMLRRFAWDYGRIALVSRNEENPVLSSNGRRENKYNVWTSLFYGDHDSNRLGGSMESLDTQLYGQDRGFCSWILAFLKVKDADIVKKCGQDALQYLSFQRYLLVYLTVVCVLSTAIIIPVNFTGNNIGNATDFGHTTIANLDSESQLLWIHALLTLFYIALAVAFMRHFSVNLKFDPDDEQVSKTLMISNIPKDKCYKSTITQHFREGYPDVIVEDVQFAYDVEKLMTLDRERTVASEARLISEMELSKTGHRPTLRPYPCGQCLCCGDSCGCREVDAITYYQDEEDLKKRDCEREKAVTYQKPLGIAFITFEDVHMAERIYSDFINSCKAPPNPQNSSIHSELNVVDWQVEYAPSPENIYWEKLSLTGWKWWMRAIIINMLLVILLFFLTTPSIVLNNLDKLNYKDYIARDQNNVLVHFLPTLLLWTFTALLPNIVYYSDQYVGHWTRTSEHHAVMLKIFVFLLLMVLILPSLGLTSAKALFEFFIVDHQKSLVWRCIFLSGNGAFFVNYVITSAFIGTSLEMLRFPELIVYSLKILFARSSAERASVRKHVIWEFQYGMEYAWVLCVFTTIMSYSVSCPLITPFGLVYMVLKHLVDRYNIYFAYKPSKISADIHWSAINFVMVAVSFLQFNLVFFSIIRGGTTQPRTIFSIVVLAIILIIFFGRICFGAFKTIGPFTRSKYKQFEDQGSATKQEDDTQHFIAKVLSDGQADKQTGLKAADTLAQSYGTMESREPPQDGNIQ